MEGTCGWFGLALRTTNISNAFVGKFLALLAYGYFTTSTTDHIAIRTLAVFTAVRGRYGLRGLIFCSVDDAFLTLCDVDAFVCLHVETHWTDAPWLDLAAFLVDILVSGGACSLTQGVVGPYLTVRASAVSIITVLLFKKICWAVWSIDNDLSFSGHLAFSTWHSAFCPVRPLRNLALGNAWFLSTRPFLYQCFVTVDG